MECFFTHYRKKMNSSIFAYFMKILFGEPSKTDEDFNMFGLKTDFIIGAITFDPVPLTFDSSAVDIFSREEYQKLAKYAVELSPKF